MTDDVVRRIELDRYGERIQRLRKRQQRVAERLAKAVQEAPAKIGDPAWREAAIAEARKPRRMLDDLPETAPSPFGATHERIRAWFALSADLGDELADAIEDEDLEGIAVVNRGAAKLSDLIRLATEAVNRDGQRLRRGRAARGESS